jgi:uncharacterized peroxidase-related enzyme
MSQREHLHALTGVPIPTRESVSEETGAYWDLCEEKLGLVPNVIRAYSFDDDKLNAFTRMYNLLMLGPSELSKLDREMIAVVVSSVNRCFYCLTAHGAAVRQLSKDPALGELLAMNYRSAQLEPRERAMLDFAWKLAETPAEIEEPDRQLLRDAGFSDLAIWDIASITAFFSMSNRMSSAIDLQPNPEYHSQAR